MPFVRIDALRADPTRLRALGRAVHEAMVETIGIPENDFFQVLTSHDGVTGMLHYDDFLGVPKDEGTVFVAITLRAGRPVERKQAMYRRIAELAQEYAGTEPHNVIITLTENTVENWSFGNGVAQYVEGAPVH